MKMEQDINEWCELIANEINSQIRDFTVGAMALMPKSSCNTIKELEEYHGLVLEIARNLNNKLHSIEDDIRQIKKSFDVIETYRQPATNEAMIGNNADVLEEEEKYAGPSASRAKCKQYHCSPQTMLVVELDGKPIEGTTSKSVFAKAIDHIGAKAVYDTCKLHSIKINGMLPLSMDKDNLPYPNTSEKISDGWYVQGNISNRDRVKRLQDIGKYLRLDMKVKMVKPQNNNQGQETPL